MKEKIEFIEKAVENFVLHTLELDSKRVDQARIEEVYVTEIEIRDCEQAYAFSLCMGEAMLDILAQKLLMEEAPDEEMRIDLLNESANLIVGNAKVIWEETASATLELSTPKYQGYFEKNLSKDFDKNLFFQAGDTTIMIGMQIHSMAL